MQNTLPLLPGAFRARLIETYGPKGVTSDEIDILMSLDAAREIPFDGEDDQGVSEMSAVTYFERVVDNGKRDPKTVINW